MSFIIDGGNLNINEVNNIARHHKIVQLSEDSITKIKSCRKLVEDNPNDMQLGARIRSLYFTIKDDRDLANEKI